MSTNINPQIKPLVSNLLRIHIGRYLKTPHFNHFALEHNLDNVWEVAKQYIRDQRKVIMIGFDLSSDYEEAYQLVLDTYYNKNKETFFELISLTLEDFIRWDQGKTDISKVITSLEALNIPGKYLLKLSMAKDEPFLGKDDLIPEKSPVLTHEKLKVDNKLCFVIMPFTDKLNPIYERIIKPIIKELNLTALRADEIFTSKPIIEDVWNNIKKAKFLIADLTDRNPNVFYELGLAHAFNKEVVLISQSLHDVPFDLRHFRIIIYKDSISGADELKSTLKQYIKEVGAKN